MPEGDGRDWNDPKSKSLLDHLEGFAAAGNKTYDHRRHIIPGAPLGWNWGNGSSWNQVRPQIAPLTDKATASPKTVSSTIGATPAPPRGASSVASISSRTHF